MRCGVFSLRNFQDEAGCIVLNLLKSVWKVLTASGKEANAIVQSGKKSFCGLNTEAIAYRIDTTKFKVSSSDQVDNMSSQSSACQALPQDIWLTERSGLSSFQQ